MTPRKIQSKNYVMATERVPAAIRPSNQARLQRAQPANPACCATQSFMPGLGTWRSGNTLAGDTLPLPRSRLLQAAMPRQPAMGGFTLAGLDTASLAVGALAVAGVFMLMRAKRA
jgi:hypothetical protein